MQDIQPALEKRVEGYLRGKAIPDPLQWSYRKWLRFYLGYCEKYHSSSRDQNSLPRFTGKLRGKKQMEQQQRQAAEAIKLEILDHQISDFLGRIPHFAGGHAF